MKAKSGIVLIREGGLSNGSVEISFRRFLEQENKDLQGEHRGRATLRYAREVGGTGAFKSEPAYMASIHEYRLEDSRVGDGRREMDTIRLDPVATKDRFDISWDMSDAQAGAIEIGFLAVGE